MLNGIWIKSEYYIVKGRDDLLYEKNFNRVSGYNFILDMYKSKGFVSDNLEINDSQITQFDLSKNKLKYNVFSNTYSYIVSKKKLLLDDGTILFVAELKENQLILLEKSTNG